VLTEPSRSEWMCLPLVGATVWLMVRTRISPLWMIGAGALIGLMGWI